MGFSVAGAGGIIFVALIVAASIMSGVVYDSIEELEESAEDNINSSIERRQTSFSIDYILYNRTSNQLTISVLNDGATVLDSSKVNLLKNGEIISDSDIMVDVVNKDGDHWPPEEELKITVKNADLYFTDSVSDRVDCKITTGISNPDSISTNSNFTYVINENSIAVYDHFGTYKKEIIDGILDYPKDVSSTCSNIYVLDNYTHVDIYDREGDEGSNLISSGGELEKPRAVSVTDENPTDYIYILDNNTHIDRYDEDGNYVDTPVDNLINALDVYVTDFIYVVNGTSNSVERYGLDGSSHTTLTSGGELSDPKNVTVSDQDFVSQYIYIIDSEDHIDVYDTDGNYVTTISEQIGSELGGIDVAGRLYVSNGLNGVYKLNLGTKIKIVLENAIADYSTI